MNRTLRVLLVSDGGAWTAQCLEHDIAAQGKTIQDALVEFQRTLVAEVCLHASRGAQGLDSIPRAPHMYWKKYHEGELLDHRRHPPFVPDCPLPPAFMIPEFREMRVA